MGTILFMLGMVVLVSGLAWIATALGFAQAYVAGAALAILAIAGISAFAHARSQEPA